MATSRRGGAPCSARAWNVSSQGSASEAAPACRNRRRLRCAAIISLAPERRTLNDSVNQTAEAISLVANCGDDLIAGRAVSQLQFMPGRVDEELLGQASGELVGILQQEPLEGLEVVELAAARQLVGRVDLRPTAERRLAAL